MLVIGLTGIIGSGKSSVAKIIKDAGYSVFDMDSIAKQIMVNDEAVRADIISEFGEEAYIDDKLNTSYLSNTIYPHKVKRLNAIIHPPTIESMMQFVKNAIDKEEESGEKMIFVESALLYEVELDGGFDYIITVDAPEEVCIERLIKGRNMSIESIEKIMKEQLPAEFKKGHADFTIENSKDITELEKATMFIVDILGELPPSNKFLNEDNEEE